MDDANDTNLGMIDAIKEAAGHQEMPEMSEGESEHERTKVRSAIYSATPTGSPVYTKRHSYAQFDSTSRADIDHRYYADFDHFCYADFDHRSHTSSYEYRPSRRISRTNMRRGPLRQGCLERR
jgi:hypothetical protein